MSDLLQDSQKLNEANAFAVCNGVKIADVQPDYAEVYLDVVPDSLNPWGTVHGGAYFTLADVCAGITARTDGRRYVTQQASVQFLHAGKEGRITVRSKVLHRGGTVCLIEVDVTDEAGHLLFLGTFNFYCVKK